MEGKNLKEYYERLDNLLSANIIVDAYSVDEDILFDFYELFCELSQEELPIWAESYIQLYSWQFQNYHEGVDGYYDNFYEHTSSENIKKAGKYLKEIGCSQVAEYLLMAVHTLTWDEMSSEEKEKYKEELCVISDWIYENREIIFKAYIDILMINKEIILNLMNIV